jgi:hypothetical protein
MKRVSLLFVAVILTATLAAQGNRNRWRTINASTCIANSLVTITKSVQHSRLSILNFEF